MGDTTGFLSESLKVLIDDNLPDGTVEFRGGDGVVLCRIENLVPRRRTWTVELHGPVLAKKNLYTPKRRGGMFKDTELQASLNHLIEQWPGDVRDLRLEHPDISFSFRVKNAGKDRDGMVTTLLDIMKECGVIVDDNIKHCNGRVTIEPATVGKEDMATITITERAG